MIFSGILAILNIQTLLLIMAGVVIGIIFGAIPGLSATMAVALCLPLTFGMDTINGMSLLIGLYIGGVSGGLISAILLNIPGTPSSIATTFDGAPMAKNGQGAKALGVGIFASFIGGLISIIALIYISPVLAQISLKFSAIEYFFISIFSLTMISSLSQGNFLKGIMSALIGMLVALVGTAPIDGLPRFTFGNYNFISGFNLVPVLIGMFAIPEILNQLGKKKDDFEVVADVEMKGLGFSLKEMKEQTVNCLRSAAIGTGIGILPGIGGATSNIIAYTVSKNSSKHPEKYGTGIIDGIVASETSNNASIGGALVPLLTLGIPGDAVTAILLGGLMMQGITPGPMMFRTNGEVIYAMFGALIVANIFMLFFEYLGIKVFVKILNLNKNILMPMIFVLCTVGAFGINNRIFDSYSLVLFGVLGYFLKRNKFPLTPIILGFILGPMIELNLRRGLMFTNNSFLLFFEKPIGTFFFILTIATILFTIKSQFTKKKVA